VEAVVCSGATRLRGPNPNPKTWYGCYTFMCTVHFGFLLSAALQCTPISEPALFRNDMHRGKDAPLQLSLLNDTLQRIDALHRSSALLNNNFFGHINRENTPKAFSVNLAG